MCAGLGRNMSDSIATDNISSEPVSIKEPQDHLGPAGDVVSSESALKWEVPDNSSVSLLSLISMLTHSTVVSLNAAIIT